MERARKYTLNYNIERILLQPCYFDELSVNNWFIFVCFAQQQVSMLENTPSYTGFSLYFDSAAESFRSHFTNQAPFNLFRLLNTSNFPLRISSTFSVFCVSCAHRPQMCSQQKNRASPPLPARARCILPKLQENNRPPASIQWYTFLIHFYKLRFAAVPPPPVGWPRRVHSWMLCLSPAPQVSQGAMAPYQRSVIVSIIISPYL